MARGELPHVTNAPSGLRAWINRVTELLTGTGTDRVLRASDLTGTGQYSSNSSGTLTYEGSGGTGSTPPAPTNLTATGAMTSIFVEWEGTGYDGHSYTEIFRADTDDLGAATKVGMSSGEIFSDAVGSDASHYYWARFVNTDDNTGGYNATAGTQGTTAEDPAYLIDQLSEAYGGSDGNKMLFTLDSPTVINGETIPAGTYMKAAFIHNAFITNLMVKDAAIDNAKIADLAVDVAKIANATITGAKIGNATIDTANIALLAITDALIANATITSAKIVSLDVSKVVASTLSALAVDAGTITAGRLQSSDGNMYIDLDDKEMYIA